MAFLGCQRLGNPEQFFLQTSDLGIDFLSKLLLRGAMPLRRIIGCHLLQSFLIVVISISLVSSDHRAVMDRPNLATNRLFPRALTLALMMSHGY